MKNRFWGIVLLAVLAPLTACSKSEPTASGEAIPSPAAQANTITVNAEKSTVEGDYHQHSWKTMIAASCTAFFDGCNQCRRSAGSDMAVCTKKMCAEYQKPRCLSPDSENLKTEVVGSKTASHGAKAFEYLCAEGKFKVFHNVYVAGDQRLKLNDNQIMLSDSQTRTTSTLTREPSASGEKYVNESLVFWEKGDESILSIDGKPAYSACKKVAFTL
ncbi:hypothetical protein TDB9533_02801 [Thalassocella blandensis]|nr:hypothetical protein TDB9533_02801 [Thalassocella blandensis]